MLPKDPAKTPARVQHDGRFVEFSLKGAQMAAGKAENHTQPTESDGERQPEPTAQAAERPAPGGQTPRPESLSQDPPALPVPTPEPGSTPPPALGEPITLKPKPSDAGPLIENAQATYRQVFDGVGVRGMTFW